MLECAAGELRGEIIESHFIFKQKQHRVVKHVAKNKHAQGEQKGEFYPLCVAGAAGFQLQTNIVHLGIFFLRTILTCHSLCVDEMSQFSRHRCGRLIRARGPEVQQSLTIRPLSGIVKQDPQVQRMLELEDGQDLRMNPVSCQHAY